METSNNPNVQSLNRVALLPFFSTIFLAVLRDGTKSKPARVPNRSSGSILIENRLLMNDALFGGTNHSPNAGNGDC